MYKHYYLPFEYGWLKLGGVGGPNGGGSKLRWYGPPLDFFFNQIWWFILIVGVGVSILSSSCH